MIQTPDSYLLKCSNIRGRSPFKVPSIRQMVLNAQRLNNLPLYLEGAVAIPADNARANIITFTVPQGTDVIITGVRNDFSGAGFSNGSGDLIWSYEIGGGFIFNYGNVTFANTASNGYELVGRGGGFLFENQQLVIQVLAGPNASANLSGGTIQAQVRGWYIPRD